VKVLVFAKPGAAAGCGQGGRRRVRRLRRFDQEMHEGGRTLISPSATPEAMGEVRKLGKVLGPRGLCQSRKPALSRRHGQSVREVKAGRVEFKIDKAQRALPIGRLVPPPSSLRERPAVIEASSKQNRTAQGALSAALHLVGHHEPAGSLDVREFLPRHNFYPHSHCEPKKQLNYQRVVSRLNASPFFLVVDYKGLTVGQFNRIAKRLGPAGSEVHVVKNSIFASRLGKRAWRNLSGPLAGQLAVVTGQRDISRAAKAVKTFNPNSTSRR